MSTDPGTDPEPGTDRLRAIEERLAALEAQVGGQAGAHTSVPATDTSGTAAAGAGGDEFFALTGLQEATDGAGGVVFAGAVPNAAGEQISWQWARPAEAIAALDCTAAAGRLAALGHPTRLALMQEIHRGTTTVAGLSALGAFGTTGQIYHHLQQLSAAGWLESPRRGQWEIPPQRLIPFLTIILAALG